MAPILGYWDIRGLATPIRLLLEYAGVQYEDKLYTCGAPPDFARPEWLNEKFSLGLDFPNLPYYIDGDVKISQSEVIMRHLARKHNLGGKNEADQTRAELLASQVRDYHMEYAKICYNPQFEELKGDYVKALPDKMKALSKFMGGNKFVCGDYVTFADFVLFEYLEGQTYFQPNVLDDFPNLKEYHQRVLALEPIDNYFKSPKAIKFPFNGAPALFGGKYSEQMKK